MPTYERLTRWSDRIKRVNEPLFPGYIFVNICERERVLLLETLGIVRLVSVAGEPAPLRMQTSSGCVRASSARPMSSLILI